MAITGGKGTALEGNVQMKHIPSPSKLKTALVQIHVSIVETRNNAKCLNQIIEFHVTRNVNSEGLPQALCC